MAPPAPYEPRAALKAGGKRVAIDTPMVDGSILLKGAKLRRSAPEEISPDHRSQEPGDRAAGAQEHRLSLFRRLRLGGRHCHARRQSLWTTGGGGTLSPGHPVTLTWDNGHGLVFTRIIAIDNQYMFTVTDSVANKSGAPATLYPYANVEREGRPEEQHQLSICMSALSVSRTTARWTPNTRTSRTPARRPRRSPPPAAGLGITDKYWMAAVVPPQSESL